MNAPNAIDFVVSDMRRERHDPRWVALVLVAAFVMVIVGATLVTGLRRDAWDGLSNTRLLLVAVLVVFAPVFARRVSGRSPGWFRFVPIVFVGAAIAAMLVDMRGRPMLTPHATWQAHLGCALVASGVATLMLVVVSTLANRLAPAGGRAQRWSIVGLAGATGVASIELHCRGVGWDHLIGGHVLPVFAVVMAAAWILRGQLDRRVRAHLPHGGTRLRRLDRLAD